MKKIRSLALVAGLALLTGCTTTHPVNAQAPTALWTLDEGTGTTVGDTSGNHNDGVLQGGAAWATGLVGLHDLTLKGTPGSGVDIANTAIDTTQSYTVAAWVKVHKLGGYQTFVSIDGANVSGFFLQLRDSGQFGLTVLPSDSTEGDAHVANAQDETNENVWYHLAGVYDAKAATISLYVNGILQETVPLTTPWHATGHTVIGRGKYGGNPVDFANADIDDVRFYKSALAAADIAALVKPYAAAIAVAPPAPLTPALLQIDASKTVAQFSPMFYGLMTEEINHSYDGGLYAELIQNRSFKDNDQEPRHWSVVQDGGAVGAIALDKTQPLNAAQSVSLKLTGTSVSGKQRVGIANAGYWGIPVQPSTTYTASFYAKASDGFSGPLTASIESNDGATVFASAKVSSITSDWKKYTVTLKTGKIAPSATNKFVISTNTPGNVTFSLVSLFPPTYKNRANGNRIDLMEKMDAMKQSFLRMPGGNYLEGNNIASRFPWKETLHDISTRPGHPGTWGYRASDGLGLSEFFYWCEDLHIESVLAVFAGYALNGEYVKPGPDLVPYVQEALDEIEYAIGDVNTKWGAVRAADGHPAPFPVHYIEIGNEDWFDKSGSYDGRFTQFFDAIKAKYPQLQCIATAGVKTRKPDVIDDHFYRSAKQMEDDVHHYDKYDRNGPKIFVGEWATREGAPTPNFNAALGDAAWLTGMERNSDVVIMEAYAPLFVNVNKGAIQWTSDLIGYDALTSYGSPSYYVQVMFANNHGDTVIDSSLTSQKGVYYGITRDSKKGTLYLKVVNTLAMPYPIPVVISGVKSVAASGTAIVLKSASPKDTNTITEPTKIVPVTSKVGGLGTNFTYEFPARSITVLQLQTK